MRPLPTKEALRLMHEGTLAFSEMEMAGVRIDRALLESRITETGAAAQELGKELLATDVWREWKRAFPRDANLDSGYQLGVVLYERLKLPNPSRTEKGQYSTREKDLLATGLPFCSKYVERKKLDKLSGTFLKGILDHLCPDGRLRPSYGLHTTCTYRSSARNPNAQNFPKRNKKMAALVRPCFIASEGRRLIEIDYAGIEVRVSACYNKDPVLIKYIEDETTDMHRDTAMQLFMIPKELVDKKTTRDWSKNRFVFPQFYGSVWFQCAPHIWEEVVKKDDKGDYVNKLPNGVSVYDHLKSKGVKQLGTCEAGVDPKPGTFGHHVRSVESDFWNNRFKVYTQWKKSWYEAYVRDGYFRSHTGFVYEWGGSDDESEGRGGRLPKRNDVLSYAIQGSASHCMLWSIIQITKWLKKNGMESQVVGQIHDSVLIDAADDEVQELLTHLNDLMTVKLREHWRWIAVPMAVEFEVSEVNGNWHQQKVWTCKKGKWGFHG